MTIIIIIASWKKKSVTSQLLTIVAPVTMVIQYRLNLAKKRLILFVILGYGQPLVVMTYTG